MTTQLVDDREAALRVGYEATNWTAPVLFEDYRAAVKDWIIKAIVRDNTCIGAAFRKGEEVHVSVLPAWRCQWITKGLLRELFSGPKVTTKVTPGHEYMHGILDRLGFKKTDNGLFVKEN